MDDAEQTRAPRGYPPNVTDQADADEPRRGRFLTLDDVALELATSHAQVYALVRRKELRSIKLGGRGQYRVAREDLEAYIARLYAETETYLDQHPFAAGDNDPDDDTPPT